MPAWAWAFSSAARKAARLAAFFFAYVVLVK